MMKTFRTSLLSIAFLGLLSCNANQTVPTNTDGHNLWFNSLGEEQTLSSTKTTMAILQNELNNHWEGKQVVNVKLLAQRNEELGNEGYVIDYNADSVVIFANTQVAALYGTYDLIRMQESGQLGKKAFSKTELPAFHNRILNHWDNYDETFFNRSK